MGVFCGRGYFTVITDGESRNPDAVMEEVTKELYRIKQEGLNEEEFITIRNMTYGNLVACFNNVESVATNMLDYEINGIGIYDGIEIAATVTFEDIKKALAEMDIDNSSISIIEPVE